MIDAVHHPRVWTNTDGIWAELNSGQVFGIEWVDIQSVAISEVDCKTHVVTFLTFDWDFGESFEVTDEFLGFDGVLVELQARFPEARDRIAQAKCRAIAHESTELWCRK